MNTTKTLLLLAVLVTAGCHRPPAESEDFQAAFELYNQLYTASLDDSYSDPRMLRVLELLKKVDPASPQAGEAKDLQDKVDKGIAEAKARADRVAADQRAAEAPAKFAGGSTTFEAPTKAALPPGIAPGPALGMTRDEFTAKFGDCFERKGEYQQGERRGEAFGLLPACKARFPAFSESLVVLIDNKVASLMPMKEITVRTVDGGPATQPLNTTPPVPAPQPAPVQVRVMPGAPRPEGAVPVPDAPVPPAEP